VKEVQLDDTSVHLFLEGVRLKYGYDFREYSQASLHRRVVALVRHFGASDPLEILSRMLQDPGFFRQVLPHLTITTTEMFRDPLFYLALRERVIPILHTYPTINIWSAGCSTGEEVMSLAILLHEERLLDRSTIYATDLNSRALKTAQDGIYQADEMKTSTKNYQEAGGKESFSRYYTADYGLAKMDSSLLSNVVFSEHSLVTDQVFAECHLILCRNVLIYFNKELQERVLTLFRNSLRYGGFLSLGSKETLRFSKWQNSFEVIDEKWRIYRLTDHENRERNNAR
jgi:chemotaxis protein methyltransferase CheR